MNYRYTIFITLLLSAFVHGINPLFAQQEVTLTIAADSAGRPVSPYIYGKNNSLSDNPGNPLTDYDWQRLRDAGIRMFRENGGNNATKYNWRRKLSSHPDWYNNVYAHDWNYAAGRLQQNLPGAQGMWAFQLIGKAAKTNSANFNDWGYNRSQWWEGVRQNLAGGGTLNPAGGEKALVEGNPNLYLEDWPADSTVRILDSWFGPGGLGLDSTRIRYWSMDNEPEIWNGTHDDVAPTQPSAEDFMQSYFAVAKKARTKFPAIKLLGPVPANEWQWYNYNGGKIDYKGKSYTWLEYFILRVGEEQKATGIRLLDVLDIHFYPEEANPADIVQLHRVYFDRDYEYPGANGVHKVGASNWDTSIKKEYIFGRCADWLNQYMGPNHGVTFSVSETGIKSDSPTLTAIWYASTLGEFARQGVEVFTPWDWKTGMYEVVHLFSQYGKELYIPSISTDEEFVSAYPMVNKSKDSMTVFIVNRSLNLAKNTTVNLSGFPIKNGFYKTYQISQLPQKETFISHTQNALIGNDVKVVFNKINLILPPMSVTAVCLQTSDEEFKTVSFQLKSTDGITIRNLVKAAITIDGDTLYSDDKGEAKASISQGSHTMKISKYGYWPIDATLTVFSDTTISEVLTEKATDATFLVKDKISGMPVNGCELTIGNQVHISGPDGTVGFSALPPEFSVKGIKEHYRDTVQSFTIQSGTLIFYIEPVLYRAEFQITNIFSNISLPGISVLVGNDSLKTDASGKTFIYLSHTQYPLKITHTYYEEVTDSVTVSSDTLFNYWLTPLYADVKFRLTKNTTPVNSALIEINDTTCVTNAFGIANLYRLPTRKTYNYKITKDGYQNITGDLYLRRDTTLYINMVLSAIETIKRPDDFMEVWPNPASTVLYIRTSSENPLITIQILSITGETLETKSLPVGEICIFDLSSYPAGIYAVRRIDGRAKLTKYFIKY